VVEPLIADRSASSSRRSLPVAVRIGILYLAARVVTTGFLWLASSLSGPSSRFGTHPGIGTLMLGWDAQWYWFTAVNGYPTTLPLTPTGQVAENQWAFMPLYAYAAEALGSPFGSWGVGAVLISLAAGFLCCLVLYRMSRMRLDERASMWAVAFFACGPLAAMFQVGYAETLFLLWLLLALWLVMRRRFGWVYVLVLLMAATRPGVLALALFFGLYGIARWLSRRRDPLPAREVWHILALGALSAIAGFAWQLIAAVATGRGDAYLVTELAWRRNWIPDATAVFAPVDGFVQGVSFWFTSWGLTATTGLVAVALVMVAVAALLLFEPHVRALGVEIRLWTASYLIYLIAVFFPQSSIFRLLLPVTPLWPAVAAPRALAWRVSVLLVALGGQWWWIYNMYALGNTYWQIP
jgi:hypothetical protein